MSLYPRPTLPELPSGRSEFEILKSSHRFLREDQDQTQPKAASWDDQLAEKYYESLFREFAVCDLKHYKSGNFSLRWRTESEVLSGAGESTCGNTRCAHHNPRNEDKRKRGRLTTLELPFSYEEQGEAKSALVKTVLCEKCLGKMMWKRRKEKETSGTEEKRPVDEDDEYGPVAPTTSTTPKNRDQDEPKLHISRSSSPPQHKPRSHSRSRSPRRRDHNEKQSRHRSPTRSTRYHTIHK
ncbi:hypothetical protein MIND_00280700 [Mycena indigotica]|uniref:Protein FRA10AC1 n=1 Tax=Mycena indigotica TaxID=2126181 RepID=A0A8H6T8E0_9AGAR|nr:uncharacterized protein MIND_00280700 [Mycena indigotica]KAF7312664.1 hypothetical protein MIND_00280700 [Mycena indigotica]